MPRGFLPVGRCNGIALYIADVSCPFNIIIRRYHQLIISQGPCPFLANQSATHNSSFHCQLHCLPRSAGTIRLKVYISLFFKSSIYSPKVLHGSHTALINLPVIPSLSEEARNAHKEAPFSRDVPPVSLCFKD